MLTRPAQPIRKPKRNVASLPPQADATLSRGTLRLLSAQRLKNNELQNRLSELTLELDKLREENRLLRRVHQREEVALKKLESQDVDLNRIVHNHFEEVKSLKEMLKASRHESRKLSNNLNEKEDEIRSVRRKNDDLNKILEDKKLLDSYEMSKKLERTEKELEEFKKKNEVTKIVKICRACNGYMGA